MNAAAPLPTNAAVRAVAFYLPQFHPIPENDRWWGKGFTEWTNVTRATPNFQGHYQPHLPADFGFYDLRVPEVHEAQAALARRAASKAAATTLLVRRSAFARGPRRADARKGASRLRSLCWADGNWTRRWDGADREF